MAGTTEPQGGLIHSWATGESGWDGDNNANLLKISRVGMHLSVIDRDLTSPPGGEADGDVYIVGASATGDWAGEDANVAVYDGSAWVFYTPRRGWLAYVEDEEVLCVYKNDSNEVWSAGIAI